jgi:hypothetical protein
LPSTFFEHVPQAVVEDPSPVTQRLLLEYGAVFVAGDGVIPPPVVVFPDERAVGEYQSSLDTLTANVGGFDLTLQRAAMEQLLSAAEEAARIGSSITPRGPDSAARNYQDTIGLWHSRVEPALVHWVEQGRLEQERAHEIRHLSPFEQVPVVLELERQGIYFAKDLSKSIIYSVAPPGASQHLSLLAFDMNEFAEAPACRIMARHGWFQTVVSDLPHFTYLGEAEETLPSLGLKRMDSAGRIFWVPDV